MSKVIHTSGSAPKKVDFFMISRFREARNLKRVAYARRCVTLAVVLCRRQEGMYIEKLDMTWLTTWLKSASVTVTLQSHRVTLTNSVYNTERDHVRRTLHLSQQLLTDLKNRQWILTVTCAIIMEIDPTSPVASQAYTILRIKRKRYEEPLDALGKPCPCRPSPLRE